MSGELRLRLLGGLGITEGHAQVRGFISSKAQALLCYLAITGRAHSREALATLLWGDMPEERATSNLRQALFNLQKLVGSHLVVTRQTVAFNRDSSYYLDTEAFTSLIRKSESVTFGKHRRLRQAVELYSGDFLDGFYARDAIDFDEWVTGQRERLRQQALDALHELSVHHISRGEYSVAIAYLRRLLELDSWREDAHRQLMLLLAYEGDSDAAIAQYRTYCRILSEELGEDPTEEATALYKRIRAGVIEAPTSHGPPPSNLPVQPAPLVGRQEELTRITELLEDPACRLLTLTGPGGIGKTRLALQVAIDLLDDFEHGAFFVSLAPISDPEMVPNAIAQALGVEDTSSRSLISTIGNVLRDKEILLLLDNFEHLLPAAPQIAGLLGASPRLRVLVTSRTSLRLRGEQVYLVPPLGLPTLADPALPEVVARSPAAGMFIERARAARPGFVVTDANARAVAEICHRLEGLPLAIELAAVRLNMMTPSALLARLERRLVVLTGGARDLPRRQQTLRATIEWSYDLLGESERKLFRRLSVFAGGCTLEAAEAVCSTGTSLDSEGGIKVDVLDELSSLVDSNLIRREEQDDGDVRFLMLETIREYALERLRTIGGKDLVHRRHAEYYLQFVQLADTELTGPEQVVWLNRLETEHHNMRAALGWALDSGEIELGLNLAGKLWRFWRMRGHLSEGRYWLEGLLAQPQTMVTQPCAEALRGAGILAFHQGDLERSAELCEESLALYTQMGDSVGSAGAFSSLGNARREQGKYDQAESLYEQSLVCSRELNDRLGISVVLNNLGYSLQCQGKLVRAAALYEESLAIRRELGDTWGIAYTLDKFGEVVHGQGDLAHAAMLCEESLALRRDLGDKEGIASALTTLGTIMRDQGDYAHAIELFEESLALYREVGEKWGIATALYNLGYVALQQADHARAKALYTESLELFRIIGYMSGVIDCLEGLAGAATVQM